MESAGESAQCGDSSRLSGAVRLRARAATNEFSSCLEFAEFMGSLSMEAQSEYVAWLLATLDDLAAGRTGDPYAWIWGEQPQDALARMTRFPKLFEVMQGHRNRWWSEQIVRLLGNGKKTLVAVGQLHVMGESGIPSLLRMRGESIEPLT